MRYLITGGSGQLGSAIYKELLLRGENDVFTPNSKEMDITNFSSVKNYITLVKPDIIFHCAAYTNVDEAEFDHDSCYMANSLGTGHICNAAGLVDATVIGISSDYVFDGKKESPYEVYDERHPINFYGSTKREMEDILTRYPKYFVVRTSWVFGENGKNFVNTMLNLAKRYDEVDVVRDQIGSPSYTPDLARGIVDLSNTDYYGFYHMTNEGYLSWYEFANLIYKEAGINIKVNPINAKDYKGAKALRPLNSMLSKDSLDQAGITRLPSVEEATHNYIKTLKK